VISRGKIILSSLTDHDNKLPDHCIRDSDVLTGKRSTERKQVKSLGNKIFDAVPPDLKQGKTSKQAETIDDQNSVIQSARI